jgi:hypothetical protein
MFLPSRFLPAVTLALLALATTPSRALGGPGSFTFDLPLAPSIATPAWLGRPVTPVTDFATMILPIAPSDTTSSLLVTIYFQEKPGGFLRIIWQGATTSQTLSNNFYEGIGMSNQRSLLISPATLLGGGSLVLQCGDATLGVQRIHLQWLGSQTALVSPQIEDTLVTSALGTTQPAAILNGQPPPPDEPAWADHLVRVPITDVPQRIEEAVEFNVQLDGVPQSGRLVLKENGLPWGKHLVLWINQKRAGTITPEVPDLRDAGYLSAAGAYVGWREGSIYLPVSFLQSGDDAVQFSYEDDGTSDATPPPAITPLDFPLAVKEVILQLDYGAGDTASTAVAVPASSVAAPPSIPVTDAPPGAEAAAAAAAPVSPTPASPDPGTPSP